MESNSDYRLPQSEHDRRYQNFIKRELLDRIAPAENPRAVILAGQSGAGKSTIAKEVIAELGGDLAVVRIDTDEIRTYHPKYSELAAAGKGASNATQPDAQRWRDQLEADAVQTRRNLVIDTTLGWPDSAIDTAKRLTSHGYGVEVRVLSAHSTESQLGIASRYYEQVAKQGAGRWVNRSYHDGVYERIPQSLEALEEKKLVQAIRVISRDGHTVHAQRLDVSNAWSTDKMASQALRDDREARAKDSTIVSRHFKGWEALEKTLDALNIIGNDREELASLRREHELELLGKVQKRSERAEAFLHEKPLDALRKFPDDENLKNAFNVLNEAHKFAGTLQNEALQKLVFQDIRSRLADSLDTGKDIPKVAVRDYEQLTRKLEREGPKEQSDDLER